MEIISYSGGILTRELACQDLLFSQSSLRQTGTNLQFFCAIPRVSMHRKRKFAPSCVLLTFIYLQHKWLKKVFTWISEAVIRFRFSFPNVTNDTNQKLKICFAGSVTRTWESVGQEGVRAKIRACGGDSPKTN